MRTRDPYLPEGLSVESVTPLINREIYPETEFPVGQWDYQLFYRESFELATSAFDADPAAAVRALFRAGSPTSMSKPARTASVRANGGWFNGKPAPNVPRDARVISEVDESIYAASLSRSGFFGPDSWYMNGDANRSFALRAQDKWRLEMPVLFVHAAFDVVCETLNSKLADPMREWCSDLSEATVKSGHWMAQEKPRELNAALAKWLAEKLPTTWNS